jgi:hypothetical protein
MPNPGDRRVENRPNIEARGIPFEIFDHLFAGWIGRKRSGHRHAGLVGMVAVCVEMKAIVVTAPAEPT